MKLNLSSCRFDLLARDGTINLLINNYFNSDGLFIVIICRKYLMQNYKILLIGHFSQVVYDMHQFLNKRVSAIR